MDQLQILQNDCARIVPPISKDCSNTFLECSFIYAAPCEWNKLVNISEH